MCQRTTTRPWPRTMRCCSGERVIGDDGIDRFECRLRVERVRERRPQRRELNQLAQRALEEEARRGDRPCDVEVAVLFDPLLGATWQDERLAAAAREADGSARQGVGARTRCDPAVERRPAVQTRDHIAGARRRADLSRLRQRHGLPVACAQGCSAASGRAKRAPAGTRRHESLQAVDVRRLTGG